MISFYSENDLRKSAPEKLLRTRINWNTAMKNYLNDLSLFLCLSSIVQLHCFMHASHNFYWVHFNSRNFYYYLVFPLENYNTGIPIVSLSLLRLKYTLCFWHSVLTNVTNRLVYFNIPDGIQDKKFNMLNILSHGTR